MTKKIAFDSNNFTLSSGKSIFPLEIAYETFGKLNKEENECYFNLSCFDWRTIC